MKHLVEHVNRQMPPNNDNVVLEYLLSALLVLIWNMPKNRMRMANKDVIDISILVKMASNGPRLSRGVRS